MTDKNAIDHLKVLSEVRTLMPQFNEAARIGINAIEENARYKELGSVEDIKCALELCSELQKVASQYSEIGTVEKCKNAVEALDKITKIVEIEQSPTSCEHTKLISFSNIEKVTMDAYINGEKQNENLYEVELD